MDINDMSKKTVEFRSHCSICDSAYDEDAGGIQGHFGMTPVTFCEWCYSSVVDMVEQMNESAPESKGPPCGMGRTWQDR